MPRFSYSSGIQTACGHPVTAEQYRFIGYLIGTAEVCDRDGCGASIDLWEAVRESFKGAYSTFAAYGAIGGRTIHEELTVKRDAAATLDMTEQIGESPNVRRVFLGTPPGPGSDRLVPLLLTGGAAYPGEIGPQLSIYGAPLLGNPPDSQVVEIMVEYLPPQPTLSRELLADAVKAHSNGDYRKAVIEAHTACDIALVEPVRDWLPDEDRLGFNLKVSALLAVWNAAGKPPIAAKLQTEAKALNTRRNNVAHPPKANAQPMGETVSADMLTAAVFLLNLVELVTK